MSSGHDPSADLIPRPNSSATAEEFAAVVVSCFVPQDKPNLSSFDPSTTQVCGAWVEILPQLVRTARSGKLFCSADKTFGAAILDMGPEGKNKSFRSLEAYGTTLRELTGALASRELVFNDEAAVTILCLGMVEVCTYTNHATLSLLG